MTIDIAPLLNEALADSAFAHLAVEAVAVARHLKPAARFTARRDRAEKFCELLHRAGMKSAEYEPEPEEWGYRHATAAEREARSARDVRVYYALDEASLARVMDAQRARDEDEIGRALGYPECCIGINSLLGNLTMTDMLRVARTGGERDWHLNIFLTEMDLASGSPYYLISHFPCRLGCPASIAYATAVFDALCEAAPDFADKLRNLLSLPVLLRDEREPPDSRRYGNFGCLLHGVAVDGNVFYNGWSSLRRGDDLEDAALSHGDCLAPDGDDINVLRTQTGEVVARLNGEQWQLVSF